MGVIIYFCICKYTIFFYSPNIFLILNPNRSFNMI